MSSPVRDTSDEEAAGPAFKSWIRRSTLAPVAAALAAARPGFDAAGFLDAACAGLEPLALKARVVQVADALRARLHPDWPTALAHLVDALPPALDGEADLTGHTAWWPVLTVVERHGLGHPDASLAALRQMTRRFSAEFAVRPFLKQDLEHTLAVLGRWVHDPDPHVRRWISEGTRPRLPWGEGVPALKLRPALHLIAALRADPSAYVRRSVANHLGDVAKDHPALAVDTARAWLDEVGGPGGDPERAALVKHALRHLVKVGHPGALALRGAGEVPVDVLAFEVQPAELTLGQALVLRAALAAPAPARAVVDLRLRFPTPAGGWSTKVFKWAELELPTGAPPDGAWAGEKRLPLRAVTTRQHAEGDVEVGLQVNGEVRATARFRLRLPA
jgi:3-methyladenine DNA glycosylase AlkC